MSTAAAPQKPIDIPAGHNRREALKRAADDLTQQAEQLASQLEKESIDPTSFEPDAEILRHFEQGNLPVSNAQKNYVYCWIYRDPSNRFAGRFVWAEKARGWEVVQGDMPEAREHLFVDGTRVVGDVVLLRMRKDRHLLLQVADRRKRIAQQEGIAGNIIDLADRAGTRVFDYTSMPEHVTSGLTSIADGRRARRMLARQLAQRRFDEHLRAGTVPGLEMPAR